MFNCGHSYTQENYAMKRKKTNIPNYKKIPDDSQGNHSLDLIINSSSINHIQMRGR